MFSGVIQFLLDSRIPFSHPDFKQIDYKHFFDEMISTSGDDSSNISHPYKLSSAYPLDRKDCFTNYTYDFKGINLMLKLLCQKVENTLNA